jgi:hypothetical protein
MQTPSIAFRYAILHAIGNCTHLLNPLMPMTWIIGQQARHEGPVMALEPNLAAELAHSNFAIIARGVRFQGTSIWFNHWRSEGHSRARERMAPTERPDIGYAMIFPSMTIVKVIAVQVVGLLFGVGGAT